MKKVKDGSFHIGFVIAYSKSTSNAVKIKYAQKWTHDQKLEDGINENKEANMGNNIPYLRLVIIIFRWDVIDMQHCIKVRCTTWCFEVYNMVFWYMHILQNGHHNNFS